MSLEMFQNQVRSTITELILKQSALFGAATGGAMMLGSEKTIGDYAEESSWKLIAGLVTARNAYSTAPVTAKEIEQILKRAPRFDWRMGPAKVNDGLLARINSSPEDAAAAISAQASQGIIEQQITQGLAALDACLSTNEKFSLAIAADSTAETGEITPKLSSFVKGRRAFGDAGQNIICWAINSDVYYSLVENDLFKNAEQLYKLGDISVFTDGLNGRFLVTDYVPSNTAYGMVNGAVIIDNGYQSKFVAQPQLGGESLTTMMQSEGEFKIAVKSYRIKSTLADTLANTVSITADQVKDPDNWEYVASDESRAQPGVKLTFTPKA